MLDRDAWLEFYAARGLATTPLRARAKRPLRSGWRTPSPSAWLGVPPDANIGILCGAPSGGLVVLDFDSADGIRESMGLRPEELAVHTLVARTARGWHVYARGAGTRTFSPVRGLDVRGDGSLVVAPPSIHPSGVAYEFLRASAPIASLASLPIELEVDVPEDVGEVAVDWERVEAWVGVQAPKLREAFALLRAPRGEFDRSRADFAVARCLWEGGFQEDEIASVLLALPGSKARERGVGYAARTVARAASATNHRPHWGRAG